MTGDWQIVGEVEVQVDRRHLRMQASQSIRTVEDALVELITNSDDAYRRLGDEDSAIMVVVTRRHAGSQVEVRDRAGGMTDDELRRKILRYGGFEAGSDGRGFMGRGAKDIVALGEATFETVKDGVISRVDIAAGFQTARRYRPHRATPDELSSLGLKKHRGGTRVTLTLSPGKTTPLFGRLCRDLQRNYALRDITCRRPLRLVDSNNDEEVIVRYTRPGGELVEEVNYTGTGPYEGAGASLQIWAAPEELPSDLQEGVIVCDDRAVHMVTRFAPDLDQDPVARRVFGRLDCAYIRKLQLDFEQIRQQGGVPPPHNPVDVVDPNRRRGLDEADHPFIKDLFGWAEGIVRKVVDHIKAKEEPKRQKIANEETERRLKQLSKAVAEHLKERLEEEQIVPRTAEQIAILHKEGVLLNPQFQRMSVGEKRRMGYIVLSLGKGEDPPAVTVDVKGPGITISNSTPRLHPSQRDPGRLIAYFDVEATALSPSTIITVRHSSDLIPPATRELVVVPAEDHFASLPVGLNFENRNYSVHDGGTRTLRVVAKGSQFRSVEWHTAGAVDVTASADCIAILRGGDVQAHEVAPDVWVGEVQLRGRGVGKQSRVTLTISSCHVATDAEVKIVSRDEDQHSSITIDLVPESGGQWRAAWDRDVPTRLKVFAKHPTLARYLGDERDGYPEQALPHFRVLLAEIVADKVVERILQQRLERDTHLAENPERLFFILNEEITTFLPLAHNIMLSDAEARALRAGNGSRLGRVTNDVPSGHVSPT